MNEYGVDFNDFYAAFHIHLSEYDPSHRNYKKEVVVWRQGQLFFNLLSGINPRVAEYLRGSLIDPFYRDEVSDEVWDFVMDNWELETAEAN